MEKTFSIIPSPEELAQLERSLRFHPSPVKSPKVLPMESVNRFNQAGFLFPQDLLGTEETKACREYFDRLLEGAIAAGKDSYSISSAHLKHSGVYDLLRNPGLVGVVSDLLGEDVIGFGSHYFCKMPGDGRAVAWHQDASYWPLSPSKTVTVWLAIDDSDPGNGCMRVIPGTHKLGHLTYRPSSKGEGNVLDQTVEEVERFGEPVDIVLKAGQYSIHSDLLLHGSEANQSDRRRCGLTLRYCAADVRASLGWNEKGVIVSGSDPEGHWANPSRPVNP